MKKCPNCQKEFPDSMRFCQTDGTPLLDEVQADDPLKTTVVRQEDIASSIPNSDPFKTVVGSDKKEDSGDLLQLPEEFDPLKTLENITFCAQSACAAKTRMLCHITFLHYPAARGGGDIY
ncbi:MAG: hypothetical protein ABJA66_19585, partial [Actinomycetota bacterium]